MITTTVKVKMILYFCLSQTISESYQTQNLKKKQTNQTTQRQLKLSNYVSLVPVRIFASPAWMWNCTVLRRVNAIPEYINI